VGKWRVEGRTVGEGAVVDYLLACEVVEVGEEEGG
jgi:hypothetical protein